MNARLLIRLLAVPIVLSTALVHAAQAPARPELYVVRNVKLGLSPDARVVDLVLRDGRIEGVGDPGAQLPAGARFVEGQGLIAVPAFVDAFTSAGCTTSEPKPDRDIPVPTQSDTAIDMRTANRKGLQPAFRAAMVLDLAKDKAKAYRESGFGALLSAPTGQVLSGTSCLMVARDAAAREAILRADVFQHAAFQASGPGYPSTLMGYVAHLRQYLLDVQHHRQAVQREELGRPGPRPPFDPDLEAGLPLVSGERRLAAHAQRWTDIQRWLDLGREFGPKLVITGGKEAYRAIERLQASSTPVILVLDWGEEPEDPNKKSKTPDSKPAEKVPEDAPKEAAVEAPPETPVAPPEVAAQSVGEATPANAPPAPEAKSTPPYEEPLAVRAERRRLWEETRDCALRLQASGVRFAFGTAGGTPAELLKRVRTLVEVGLPAAAALDALTSDAAQILGVERELGRIEVGQRASLALWTKSPLEKDAQLAWLFVEGYPHEFERKKPAASSGPPAEGLSVAGTWDLTIESGDNTRRGTATMTMEASGETKATVESDGFGGRTSSVEYSGHLSGKTLTLTGSTTRGDQAIELSMRVEVESDSFSGSLTSSGSFGERTSQIRGIRRPQR